MCPAERSACRSVALSAYEQAQFWAEFAAAADAVRCDPDVATQESADNRVSDAATARDTADRS